MKASHILGMNSRNYLYLSRYNRASGKRIADSKLLTKKFLRKLKLPHPRLLASFKELNDVRTFDWTTLADNFVIKPAGGYAGEGIVLVRRRMDGKGSTSSTGSTSNTGQSQKTKFQLMDGSVVQLEDLKIHVLDILEGRYDKYNLPGLAIIEERIPNHPKFKRYSYRGTPDVRVILFNRVPIMAMLRLPTPASKGRANLHQGAIGVGIDLASGVTTRAVRWDKPITHVPDTNLKLNGLQIPGWDRVLEISATVAENLELGYMAVDFLIDPDKGPVIVELTARPGLSIQLANMSGLKRRLERVEGLDIDKGKGVEVAKALFAERFSDKVIAEKGVKVVSVFEMAKILTGEVGERREKKEVPAKVDTGAFRSSIDRSLAETLGLLGERSVLWHDYYYSSLGREQRPIIPVTFWLGGRKVETTASVADRSKQKEKLLVGRRDLGSFLIKAGE